MSAKKLMSIHTHIANVPIIVTNRMHFLSILGGISSLLQRCIVSNEFSCIDIAVQIILIEPNALMDHDILRMRLKSNACKTLLAVMESHQDMDIIDKIMLKIGNPDSLVRRWAGFSLLYSTVCEFA